MAYVRRGVISKKTRTDHCRQLDMKSFARDVDLTQAAHGYTQWGINSNNQASIGWRVEPNGSVLLHYTLTDREGNRTDYAYYVAVDRTECYFGGCRWWWSCPSCNRRCRILYLPPGQRYFACRICHRLTYKSQQEGRNRLVSVFRSLDNWPRWLRQLNRRRSQGRRAQLLRKINRVEGDMQWLIKRDKGGAEQ